MLNLFLGFAGRLRRRDFIMWSILVPLVLILPPAISIATNATSLDTTLAQDLSAAGMMEAFIGLVCLMNYISLALFWKRMNDVDDETRRRRGGGIMRWSYAVLTVLNTFVVCGNLAVDGDLKGSTAGFVLLVFWMMACWLKPHVGDNASGPDPRDLSRRSDNDVEEASPSGLGLATAMQRAVSERQSRSDAVFSPKLVKSPLAASTSGAVRPSFGKRG